MIDRTPLLFKAWQWVSLEMPGSGANDLACMVNVLGLRFRSTGS